MQEQLPSSEEALETKQSEGPKNQETEHFERLQETARSIPKRANVATAAALRAGGRVRRVDSRW